VAATAKATETYTAHAEPTKRLLVDVLTKDIDLIAAILDLVDNSVDAARRVSGEAERLKGYKVELTITHASLELTDNCGGISLLDAEERAFRFGPDPDDPPDDFTTGQFGIGMKRALFKLGKTFEVRSRSANDQFDLKVRVADWVDSDSWRLPLENVKTGQDRAVGDRGTTIVVKPLKPEIARELQRGPVVNDLKTQLADRHQRSIARGLVVRVNKSKLAAKEPQVVQSNRISPYVGKSSLNGRGDAPIDIAIVCGVSPGSQREGGWYVYLNDRAVLLADKTAQTGWGEDDEKRIPRFHGQYGRFRGFAFLSCKNTTRLPWNTTKTGLDADDSVYRKVRNLMVDAADPIVDFLDDVDEEEKAEGEKRGEVGELIYSEKTVSVYELAKGKRRAWRAPSVRRKKRPDPTLTTVYTEQPLDLVDEVKAVADVDSNRALGDHLFTYFVQRELE
jgi:hypothetical protein